MDIEQANVYHGKHAKIKLISIDNVEDKFLSLLKSLTGHTSGVQSLAFSTNEDKIVSGSVSGSLKVWDLEVNKRKFQSFPPTSLWLIWQYCADYLNKLQND